MKKCLTILVLCFSLAYVRTVDIATEDSVLVLNASNFDLALEQHKFILVEFYAPWCGACKGFAPEYAKTAKKLEDDKSDIKLAKVDATVETALANKFQVAGYPTLKFFRNGELVEYTGGRTSKEIIKWLKKKTGPVATTLVSAEVAKKFKETNELFVVGFFKTVVDSADAKAFLDAAATSDELFAIAHDQAVFDVLGGKDGQVTLFKPFDEKRNDIDATGASADDVRKFVRLNSLPLVSELTFRTAHKIFGGDIKLHILLFLSQTDKSFQDNVKIFRKVAADFKGRVMFATVDTDEHEHGSFMEFFGMTKSDKPQMRMTKVENMEMSKFKPDSEKMDADKIRKFVQGVLDGKVKNYRLSQDVPKDWDKHPVKVLVGKNFNKVAYDKSKRVLVAFLAPKCKRCEELAPILEELGEKYKDRDDTVVAKIDGSVNELEDYRAHSLPAVILVKKGTNEVVEYNGEPTLEGLSKFLDTDGDYGKSAPEKIEKDKGEKEDTEHAKDEL